MPIESDGQHLGIHRSVGAIAVVCASLIFAAGSFYWHFEQEMAAGNTPKEQRFYEGSLKGTEFWYRASRASGNPLSPVITTRLNRLDLESGTESETEFTFAEFYVLPVWVGDNLFVYTPKTIYQIVGSTVMKLEPAPFSRCLSIPFLYDGQMTIAYETRDPQEDGSYDIIRLAQWVDGKWVEGPRILLPGFRFWYDDPERGRKVLLPRTSALTWTVTRGGTIYYFEYYMVAVQDQQQTHLLMTSLGGLAAYRDDIEFADEDPTLASALTPENAPPEPSGWEPVVPSYADDYWVQMAGDRDGLLFVSSVTNDPIGSRIVRRNREGNIIDLSTYVSHKPDERVPWIAVDSSNNDHVYVIHSSPIWGSATICRIDGNQIQPPHLIVPGFKQDYIARWQRVGLRLSSVWLLPMFALLLGANWFVRGSAIIPVPGAGRHSTLASLWRRSLALVLDAAILLMSSRLLWQFGTWQLGLVWPLNNKHELVDSLASLEWEIRTGTVLEIPKVLRDSQLDWLLLPFEFHSSFFGILVASVLPVCIVMVYMEGRFGFTPGKWLAGIRVVRTTLRPCGFARALIRKVMYWIDFPLLLTPIPAVVSIILTEHAQRIGDRIADTIVVDVGQKADHTFIP